MSQNAPHSLSRWLVTLPMTVLIVEDNAGVRRLLRRTLADVATDIWECDDGVHALEAYLAHRPDVVLMDIRMPRLDGLAATEGILRVCPSARIFVVTDYDDDELRNAARRVGACGYVLKLNLLELAQLVRSACGDLE